MQRSSVILAICTTAGAIAAGTAFGIALPNGDSTAAMHPAVRHGAMTGAEDAPGDLGDRTAGHTRTVYFAAGLGGDQEAPPADPAGRAVAFLRVRGDQVSYAFHFHGTGAPTMGHLHEGDQGQNGPVRIPFFTTRLPGGRTSATGTVRVTDGELLADLVANPGHYYLNLHTDRFPAGAVRGRLHRLSGPADLSGAPGGFAASVVDGRQLYTCTRQPDRSFAFARSGARATLDGGIGHLQDRPGTAPRWKAADGSEITGTLLAKLPNGDDNIPELDLAARQSGARNGLLSRTGEVLRLNTRGGTAPSGSCDPGRQPRLAVPYRADYLFVNHTASESAGN
ncbi:CHRD domain-containing protein [Streptomyces orinoci]|uniref:CHRD domain-containing protein n=1 Tax=Streptomyces orinoci TaxID=67339 RepID=A0ABV3K5Y9_STRON|nr:CHRD domain-containing protein [Streptomyces orinoci]